MRNAYTASKALWGNTSRHFTQSLKHRAPSWQERNHTLTLHSILYLPHYYTRPLNPVCPATPTEPTYIPNTIYIDRPMPYSLSVPMQFVCILCIYFETEPRTVNKPPCRYTVSLRCPPSPPALRAPGLPLRGTHSEGRASQAPQV